VTNSKLNQIYVIVIGLVGLILHPWRYRWWCIHFLQKWQYTHITINCSYNIMGQSTKWVTFYSLVIHLLYYVNIYLSFVQSLFVGSTIIIYIRDKGKKKICKAMLQSWHIVSKNLVLAKLLRTNLARTKIEYQKGVCQF